MVVNETVEVDMSAYEPSPGSTVWENRNIYDTQLGMLRWLTRGKYVVGMDEEIRAQSYYNDAMRELIARELDPYMSDPSPYHIRFARNLINQIRKYRHVPGDERGRVYRSGGQPHRGRRGKHKARHMRGNGAENILPSSSQHTRVTPNWVHIREQIIIDPPAGLVAAVRPFVMFQNAPLHDAYSGKADVLIQCAHGPCQRYIPVDQESKWCDACNDAEHDALYGEAEIFPCITQDDNGDKQCVECYRCLHASERIGQRFPNQ